MLDFSKMFTGVLADVEEYRQTCELVLRFPRSDAIGPLYPAALAAQAAVELRLWSAEKEWCVEHHVSLADRCVRIEVQCRAAGVAWAADMLRELANVLVPTPQKEVA